MVFFNYYLDFLQRKKLFFLNKLINKKVFFLLIRFFIIKNIIILFLKKF